jgi:CRISPR-associated protein Csb2
MPSFSLVIEYLTGYAVATDSADRERPEWPPHPARVYMALAAAHFETNGAGKDKSEEDAERAALDWLAALPPPDVTIPEHSPRDVQTVYVPVNDMELPKQKTIDNWNPGKASDVKAIKTAMTILPPWRTNKQPRTFPRVYVGSEPLRQTWHLHGDPPSNHLDALESICRHVTRIGHSSSLVWARLERDSAVEPTHVPDEDTLDAGLRIVQAGAMQRLEEAFNKSAIEEFADWETKLDAAKGKAKKELKSQMEERFSRGRPTSQRPVFSIRRGYRRVESSQPDAPHTLFDPNFVVLREADDAGQTFGLESTVAITYALRGLLMSESKVQPPPPWVSGHEADGTKLESGHHLALIPLPFVGREHAEGHLMGLGVVPPRSVSLRERARVLASILFDEETNQPRTLGLNMGRTGVWRVVREADLSPRYTLRTETYTMPCRAWASVTPVLLDRMPKANRIKDPCGWREDVARIISQSCRNVDLPEPVSVRTEKTPFFRGSLRAMPGQGGFPQLRKDKHQVHVAIEFDRPVCGPVLLGAGRFCGYGLMRPWMKEVGA